MDSHQFDDLTRTLAGATSRRQLLKGLAGGLGAAIPTGGSGGFRECCSTGQRCTQIGISPEGRPIYGCVPA
jgi:hypothetical protein